MKKNCHNFKNFHNLFLTFSSSYHNFCNYIILFLTSSSWTVAPEFVYVVVWSDSAPRTSPGIGCGTTGVSSVAVNEGEYTALTASCSHAAGSCGQDIKGRCQRFQKMVNELSEISKKEKKEPLK